MMCIGATPQRRIGTFEHRRVCFRIRASAVSATVMSASATISALSGGARRIRAEVLYLQCPRLMTTALVMTAVVDAVAGNNIPPPPVCFGSFQRVGGGRVIGDFREGKKRVHPSPA
jgi:hypothetical protein